VSSSLLFYLGMAFAFYVVFPLVFSFIVATAPEGVTVMTDMADYLDFVLTLFFAFGVAFEIPIATIILLWTGVVSRESLAKGRPYIIVGAFVIGMLLTPPDVISQVLLALPMWVLFEAGLVASRFFIKKPDDEDADEEEEEPAAETSSASAASAGQASEPHGAAVAYPDDYVEPTDEEMEQALDSLDEEDEEVSVPEQAADEASDGNGEDEARAYEQRYREEYDEDEEGYYDKEDEEDADAIIEELVESKLNRIMSLRMEGDEQGARALLYEVLSEGNEDQKRVARNILQQMDS
jgi:sec-independent protein translocase protein TatC